MAQTITIDIVAETRKLQQGLDDANRRLSGIQSATTNVQNLSSAFVGVGVAAAGFSAATGFIGKTTNAASDLNEAISKNQVIFGDASAEIEKFAGAAAKNLGQSKVQALDAASNFAIFGKSAGLAGNDLTSFSTNFVGLSADLASFSNTSADEAITAIGAALRGENEPIRKYGVLINDAALRQAALELGIVQTTKEALTPQQRVLAAQKLIYEQTTDAQGDFLRTSDGLANSTKILEAEQANLNTDLGEIFLPIMKELTNILRIVVGAFTALPKEVQTTIVVLGLVVATVGPLILLVSSLITAFKTIGTVLGGFQLATKAAAAIQGIFNAVMAANPIVLVTIVLAALVAGLIFFFTQTEVGQKAWKAFTEFLGDAIEAVSKFIGEVLDNILNFFKNSFEAIRNVIATVTNVIKNIIETIFNGIKAYFEFVFNLYKTIFTTVFNAIKDTVETVFNAIKGVTEKIFNGIKDFFTTVFDSIKGIVDTVIGTIRNVITGAWTFIYDNTVGAFNKLKDFVGTIWNNIKDRIIGFIDNIVGAFGNIFSAMADVGKNIVEGIWNGISGLTTWFRDKILGFFGNLLPGWVKDALGIKSPSAVFQELGKNITQGTAKGLTVPRLNTARLGLSGGAVNVTINAGLGTNPYQLGKEVNKALNNYSRVTRV